MVIGDNKFLINNQKNVLISNRYAEVFTTANPDSKGIYATFTTSILPLLRRTLTHYDLNPTCLYSRDSIQGIKSWNAVFNILNKSSGFQIDTAIITGWFPLVEIDAVTEAFG